MSGAQWFILTGTIDFLKILGILFNFSKTLYCDNSQLCDVDSSRHKILCFSVPQQNIEIWIKRPGILLKSIVNALFVFWVNVLPIK